MILPNRRTNLLLVFFLSTSPSVEAFPLSTNSLSSEQIVSLAPRPAHCCCPSEARINFRTTSLRADPGTDDSNDDHHQEEETKPVIPNPLAPNTQTFLSRFTDPEIDDPNLLLTDVSMAQIVAPSLQVFWLTAQNGARPSWLQPVLFSQLLETRGSIVAPTLIHGAGLAVCWVLGVLAAKGYKRRNIDPGMSEGSYGRVIRTLLAAGACATGLLILATQVDLFHEFGNRYVQVGDAEQSDLRIFQAFVEVVNDVFFEAVVLITVRVYIAVATASNGDTL